MLITKFKSKMNNLLIYKATKKKKSKTNKYKIKLNSQMRINKIIVKITNKMKKRQRMLIAIKFMKNNKLIEAP